MGLGARASILGMRYLGEKDEVKNEQLVDIGPHRLRSYAKKALQETKYYFEFGEECIDKFP
jgi:hypothetical protein